jgi:hypothetical protein
MRCIILSANTVKKVQGDLSNFGSHFVKVSFSGCKFYTMNGTQELRRWGGWGKKDNYMGSVPAKGPGDLYTSETLIQEKTSTFVHWLVYCQVAGARFMYNALATALAPKYLRLE